MRNTTFFFFASVTHDEKMIAGFKTWAFGWIPMKHFICPAFRTLKGEIIF